MSHDRSAAARSGFLASSPELAGLAHLERKIEADGSVCPVIVVYPGAPLGAEEMDLFKSVAPHVRIAPFVSWKAGLVT